MNLTEPILVKIAKEPNITIDPIGGYEALGIMVDIALAGLTLMLVCLIYTQVTIQTNQKEYQQKLESARFLVEFKRNLVKDHKDLINTISKVVNGNGWSGEEYSKFDDRAIRVLLNDFEMLSVGWKDGTWETEHIDEYMGTILMNVKNEIERVMPILENVRDNNIHAYTILPKLLDEISKRRK